MPSKKIWIGRWMIFVAIAHTIVGFALLGHILMRMLERGVWNSVGSDMGANVATWFMLCGAVLALLGMAVSALERSSDFRSARALGIGTLMLTVLGVVLMPLSGFWLCFPPAIGLLRR